MQNRRDWWQKCYLTKMLVNIVIKWHSLVQTSKKKTYIFSEELAQRVKSGNKFYETVTRKKLNTFKVPRRRKMKK